MSLGNCSPSSLTVAEMPFLSRRDGVSDLVIFQGGLEWVRPDPVSWLLNTRASLYLTDLPSQKRGSDVTELLAGHRGLIFKRIAACRVSHTTSPTTPNVHSPREN